MHKKNKQQTLYCTSEKKEVKFKIKVEFKTLGIRIHLRTKQVQH
jgi:hypothetical protein